LPVVATPTAVSAIAARPGHDLLVARDSNELAAAAVRLLRNPEMCTRLGDAGRVLVEQRYAWSSVARGLAEVYREARA
jgi:polysaccharide biosynthesis protein PslH